MSDEPGPRVSDEVWRGAHHFDDDTMLPLVGAIAPSTMNRLSIALRTTPSSARISMIEALDPGTPMRRRSRHPSAARHRLPAARVHADAEDVGQDALLKPTARPDALDPPSLPDDATPVRHRPPALRRVRRETYSGRGCPSPWRRSGRRRRLGPALLAIPVDGVPRRAESLSPEERAALLLHDVFGYSHAETAKVLDRSEGASRQLLHRAHKRIEADRPRFAADPDRQGRLVQQFREACEGGDMASFLAVLTEDAVLISDGGGSVMAARRPVVGHRAARSCQG